MPRCTFAAKEKSKMKYLIAIITFGVVTITAAQAEIICTNRGCYETGM